MWPGLDLGLYGTALIVGLACWAMIQRRLGPSYGLVVAAARVAIPLIYFSWFYTGRWNLLDDLAYANAGSLFLQAGYGPLSILHDSNALERLRVLVNGPIGYGWFNVLSQYVFGVGYSSAVFANVLLTFVTGVLLCRLAENSGFSAVYTRGLLVFFLLHWDVVSWSSFVDVKDILVMTLVMAALYGIATCTQLRPWPPLVLIAGSLAALYSLRFYELGLLMMATIVWAGICTRGRQRQIVLVGGLAVAILTAPFWLQVGVQSALATYAPAVGRGDWAAIGFGFIHFLLNPAPWSVQSQYSFLTLASLLNWMAIIPAVVGAFVLPFRSRQGALLVAYVLVITVFYAMVAGENGMRFRVQMTPALAWCQWQGLVWLFSRARTSRRLSAAARGAVLYDAAVVTMD